MMWFRTACLMLGLLLAGCAETTYVVEQSKAVSGNTTPRTPYKVGNPYQVNGVWYYPAVDYNYDQTGIASWYGPGFAGHATASGEEYDQDALTAAHKTLPMPTLVRVTNLENGRQIQLRINDRGPFVNDRIIDLSRRGAQLLGMINNGTAKVRVQIMPEESRQLALGLGAGEEGVPKPTAAPAPQVSTQALAAAPTVQPTVPPPAPVIAAAPAPAPSSPTPPSSVGLSGVPLPQPSPKVVQEPVHPTNIFIQAGSFLQIANAEHLKDKLSRKVGAARVIPVQVGAQKFYRVRVGPIATVDQADQMLDQVFALGHKDARIIVE
ncbi:MAG TPA: septal ring lytic transglycosylase RlpA family protein [Dongiaceae bacterium]